MISIHLAIKHEKLRHFTVCVTSASPTGGSFSFRVVAAFSNSGANFLQCPHLKKVNTQVSKSKITPMNSINIIKFVTIVWSLTYLLVTIRIKIFLDITLNTPLIRYVVP